MFIAEIISLSGDMYHKNVPIIEPQDYERFGVFPHLQDQTCVFIADGKIIQVHHYNINLIKLDLKQRTSIYPAEMIIIVSEMKYANSYVIPETDWEKQGIPTYFNDCNCQTGQFVWSNSEGTFISLISNVLKIENPEPRKPIQSQQIPPKINIKSIQINSINFKQKIV